MNQVKCPHCGKEFTIDESSYLDIVKQIKDKEFHKDLHERLEQLKLQSEKDIVIAKQQVEKTYVQSLSQKEQELQNLKQKLDNSNQAKALEIIQRENTLKEQLALQEKTHR